MVEVVVQEQEPRIVPDVYFSQAYGSADARRLGGRWMTITDVVGDWQMPVVLADAGDGHREAISPYGYSGIHLAAGLTRAAGDSAWASAHELLRALGVVSLFLRFSPFSPGSVAAAEELPGLTVNRSRTTYVMDTTEPDHLWENLRSNCRSRIRKARKNGFTGEIRPATITDLTPGGDFRRLYDQTMARLGADPFYQFSDDYHAALLDGLRSDLLVSEVRDSDGVVVSAATFMRHGHRLHYHLAGSDPEGALMGSNNLMMWTAAEFAADGGLRQLHLGGGLSEGDGLARFKSTFGGEPRDFHVGTAVIDAAAYRRLTQTRAEELGTSPEVLEQSGYFPAFRASVS